MRVSYEFYLLDGEAKPRFELFTCETPQEAMEEARRLLEEPGVDAVEVKLGGVLQFTVSR